LSFDQTKFVVCAADTIDEDLVDGIVVPASYPSVAAPAAATATACIYLIFAVLSCLLQTIDTNLADSAVAAAAAAADACICLIVVASDMIDEDLVDSIVVPASDPSAAAAAGIHLCLSDLCPSHITMSADTIDEDLVDSIVVPASDPSAAEVFYRINSSEATSVSVNALLKQLRGSRLPLLLLWGDLDPWITPKRVRMMIFDSDLSTSYIHHRGTGQHRSFCLHSRHLHAVEVHTYATVCAPVCAPAG
jgi:pimeloyl-ACP methyl ester carboxylesterase